MAKLDFYHAFRYNMVVFATLPVSMYVIIRGIIEYIYDTDFMECYLVKFGEKYYKILFAIVIGWTIIRNLIPYCKV